jgi:hypothetical protein
VPATTSRSGRVGMITTSRIATVVALLIAIGGMPAAAQQNPQLVPQERPAAGQQAAQQQIREHLGEAREALEQENYADAELALLDAHAELEGMSAEAALGQGAQLRTLIEAALEALKNEDYATALQTVQEAELMAGQQRAGLEPPAPDTALAEAAGPPLVVPSETPSRGIGGGSGWNGGSAIRAARLFSGPSQYPPEAFAAYGIVAFRARASSGERERHVMLCEAYVAALPRSAELTVPVEEQMVTIWPIDADQTADELNRLRGAEICETAVGRYGLPTALRAINDAGETRIGRDRRGPFLLAWSPSHDKGDPEALMLVADLTDVTTYAQAEAFFVLWRTDIEANPEYWNRGWNVERLRIAIQLWVDRFGSQIFSILGG